MPGQEVNKDEYATNTGSIAAFVEQKVSGKISITKEEDVAVTQTTKAGVIDTFPTNDLENQLVTLSVDDVYSVEAGSYLAYAPTGSTNEVGRQIVIYPPTFKYYKISDNSVAIDQTAYDALSADNKKDYVAANASATDFKPTTEGLYVFRRVIDVADDRSETFEYVGYYYKDGQYYEVSNLNVTPDTVRDLADDGVDSDGVITAATFTLVKEVKDVATTDLFYDSENNRLVATYGTTGTTVTQANLESLAQALDQAEHNLAAAGAQLDRAILDADAASANVQMYMDQVAQLEAEKTAAEARLAELQVAIAPINTQVTTLSGADTVDGSVAKAKKDAEDAMAKLYGASSSTAYNATTGAITFNETTAPYNAPDYSGHEYQSGTDSKYNLLLKAEKELKDAETAYGDSTFMAYVSELNTAFSKSYTSYADAIADLSYAELTGASAPTFDASSNAELHEINALTIKLLEAQEAYDKAKTDAENALADYINKKNTLGEAGTTSSASQTDKVAGVDVTYTKVTQSGGSGLLAEQQRLQAAIDTLNSTTNNPKGKIPVLTDAIATARGNATNAATTAGQSQTAQTILATEESEYNAAVQAYYTALNNYNNALNTYNTQDQKLVIYVNLADVVTTTGEADKWQLLPVPANSTTAFADNTAVFYYTGILESGETSSKLIDSVELDKNTTQNMYKSFDFDLNMELKSAQITYADDNVTIKTDAAVDELDATPTLYEPTNIGTAVAWS